MKQYAHEVSNILGISPTPWMNCNSTVDDAFGIPILRMFRWESQSNVPLASAAPELYQGCLDAVNMMENIPHDDFKPIIQNIKQVLNKIHFHYGLSRAENLNSIKSFKLQSTCSKQND